MYEDILKFLKSKNKKLTKEEASEFIRLLAESVGYEEELGIHAHIENIDNSDEEMSTDINFVIDSINEGFSEEEDTFSLEGLSDEEEEEKEYVVLSKRKIVRGMDFKRKKLADTLSDEKEVTEMIADKKKTNEDAADKSANEDAADKSANEEAADKKEVTDKSANEDLISVDQETDHQDGNEGTISEKKEANEDAAKKEANEDLISEREVATNNGVQLNDKKFDMPKMSFNLPKNINFSTANFAIPKEEEDEEIPKKTGFKLPEFKIKEKPAFKLPEFRMPGFKPDAQNEEFKFDLGNLKDVNNTGPDYKFYDEENKEI